MELSGNPVSAPSMVSVLDSRSFLKIGSTQFIRVKTTDIFYILLFVSYGF